VGLQALTVNGSIFANNLTVTGTTTTGVLSTALANITAINGLQSLNVAGNINAGTISASITTANQPNITNVGTLTNLNVSGNNINTTDITATGTVNTNTLSAATANITTIRGSRTLMLRVILMQDQPQYDNRYC
jgi:hypothetical protein